MKISSKPSRGFTMIEMLAVVAIIGTLAGLLLPSVQAARERARQISCSNNLMQVGLGVTAYHAAFEQLPTHMSGTDGSTVVGADNDRRLSFLVALLPFLGHETTTEKMRGPIAKELEVVIARGYTVQDYSVEYAMEIARQQGKASKQKDSDAEPEEEQKYWVAGGPEPFQGAYIIWLTGMPEYRCPSDPGVGTPAMARTNYACCLGDAMVAMDTGPLKEVKGVFQWDEQRAAQTEAAMRGAFVPRLVTRFRDITDGLSATLLLGEIATDLGDRDTRTAAVVGPGEKVLRNRPNWAYETNLIDGDRPRFWLPATTSMTDVNPAFGRGFRWADGAPLYTAFNTILPPNAASTLSRQADDSSGILPPSSRHQGGAGVCMVDGSVRFVSDSVDAGDRHSPTVYVGSPNQPGQKSVYGIWGAMGTRASEELVWFDNDR